MRYMQITFYILATCLCFLNADVQRGQVQGQVAQLLAEQEVLRGPRTLLYRIVLQYTVLCTAGTPPRGTGWASLGPGPTCPRR